jgi:hypothetical protein
LREQRGFWPLRINLKYLIATGGAIREFLTACRHGQAKGGGWLE